MSVPPESDRPVPDDGPDHPPAERRRIDIGPTPLEKPARGATTMRDMIGAVLLLVLVSLFVGGVARGCSFAPGGPTVADGSAPVVDAPAELTRLAPTVPVPLRIPAVPADWRSNNVGQDRVEAADGAVGRAVVTGYLTGTGTYLRFVQSDAAEEALLGWEAGETPVVGRGAVDVDGVQWVVYDREDDEPIWVANGAEVRWLITGSADEEAFRTLASAAATGEVLPTS